MGPASRSKLDVSNLCMYTPTGSAMETLCPALASVLISLPIYIHYQILKMMQWVKFHGRSSPVDQNCGGHHHIANSGSAAANP